MLEFFMLIANIKGNTMNDIIEVNTDWIICECGNDNEADGFYSCNDDGEFINPTEDAHWKDLYKCPQCGQIYRYVGKANS